MKIQCISQKSASPNTFLLKVKQHVVLLNCPLERLELKSTDRPQQQQQGHDLGSILSSFGEVGKRALDTQYSLSDNNIQHCDSHSVFRIAADLSLIDINSIDLVLIANSHLMLGLPYLTEYLGYKGRIIATEPTVEYAR
jgi:integrator complex subunit 9